MGGSASAPVNATAVEVAPASGDSGPIRRHAAYADRLRDSAYDGVNTCYDVFQ